MRYLPTPCTNHSTNDAIHLHSATAMSSTTPDNFPVSASDIAHTLDRALDGQICTDQHPIHALIVSAIQRARTSNPHGLCSYTWCGVKHDPLCCCICFGISHKTMDCWHLNGLSDNRKELLIKAKEAKQSRLPPFDSPSRLPPHSSAVHKSFPSPTQCSCYLQFTECQ